jgi:peptide/nickel transport system substrate-binding protein
MDQSNGVFKSGIFSKSSLKRALHALSKKEWYVFVVLFSLLIISTFGILWKINNQFLNEVPAYGGTIHEGIVGTPRFINPVLALSDADRDITSLVYAGLMKKLPDGTFVPDMAESYTLSEDGLEYIFTLRPELTFHDGHPLTADDVVFTVQKIKDPLLKSPRRLNWEGVLVEKIDDRTISFSLKQPFASFMDNTTTGIVPSHIWADLTPEEMSFSDLNTYAIGSGPFSIKTVNKKSSGIPESYELKSFKKYALGRPYLSKMIVHFYANEKDLAKAVSSNNIDHASGLSPSYSAELETEGYQVANGVLPRIFGLYYNQTQAPVFTDRNVISAIDRAIDKDKIVREVLYGYGTPINSPIPQKIVGMSSLSPTSHEEARNILDNAGWKINANGVREKTSGKDTKTLEFSITTVDSPELTKVAEYIKQDLLAIGIPVDIRVYDMGTLNQSIIRPRKYDMLLFGQIINHESDLFAFWHSSQRNDPGLNIAQYANSKVDKLLETFIGQLDDTSRTQTLSSLREEMSKDFPAVFIYSPDFTYVIRDDIKNVDISGVIQPSDRFSNIASWYLYTDRVWKVFIKN